MGAWLRPDSYWQRLNFVGRLLVTASAALIVAGLVMVLVSARQEAVDVRADLLRALERELETLPATLGEAVVIGDYSTLQQTLDNHVRRPLLVLVRYLDGTGVALEAVDSDPVPGAPDWFTTALGYVPVEGTAPVVIGGREYGALTLVLSPHDPARRAWRRLLNHLAILWLAVTLDFIGIWLVLRFGLRPLAQLSAGADALAAGRLDTRLPEEGSPELCRLIGRFNDMAAAIEAMQADLQEARQRAEAASMAKSRFLANMSHEIRTPLNGMLGMAQLLMMPDVDEAERIDYARTLHESGGLLLTLLTDILDLSKVEAGKMELHPVAFAPEQMLEEVLGLFGEVALGKGLSLTARWDGPPQARYCGDVLRLRQMLTNLVSNAIKFTEAGRVVIEAAESERGTGWAVLRFTVRDTGIGIAAGQQAVLFKPFSQADGSSTRAYGGTGLGLAIVRDLALLMSGNAGLKSELGAGSTFWFDVRVETLPAPAAVLPAPTLD